MHEISSLVTKNTKFDEQRPSKIKSHAKLSHRHTFLIYIKYIRLSNGVCY